MDYDDHIDTTPREKMPERLRKLGWMLHESGGARDYDFMKRVAYELEMLMLAADPEEVRRLTVRIGELERALEAIRITANQIAPKR